MKNILVPIGSNENSKNTLQYAIDFVEGTDAKIYIIQVYGIGAAAMSMKDMDAVLEKDSDKELEQILMNIDKKGVEIISKSIKGNIIDSIERVANQLHIDLIISATKSISTDEKVFLGKVTGGLIKHTMLPLLVIPKAYKFKKLSKVLTVIKSGVIVTPNMLEPLKDTIERFHPKIDLLRVITPNSNDNDAILDKELSDLNANYETTENATIFQGVLEHLHESNPDLLCVIRRKRGFFKRLWEKERIYKKDFESRIPLLVLKGAF